jgi:putative proteasome-type protease
MTYCVGILLDQGLVLASDTRTNAGVDHVAIFPKMHLFEVPNDRIIVLLTAGNLAITQSVVTRLREAILKNESEHLNSVRSLFDAASLVGDQVRFAFDRDAEHLKNHNADFHASIIVAGQIKGEKPRLFNIYNAGNFIEASDETPYFQIGETKYGKPIIDRVISHDTDIIEAAKCVLISFDSTIRSNVSVAAPIDLLMYESNQFKLKLNQRISEDNAYYASIRKGWSEGLKSVFSQLPNPDWN